MCWRPNRSYRRQPVLKHVLSWDACRRTVFQRGQEVHPLAARFEQTARQTVAVMRMVPTTYCPVPSTIEWELAIHAPIFIQSRVAATALSANTAMNVHLANSSVDRRPGAGLCIRQLLPPGSRSISLVATIAKVAAFATLQFHLSHWWLHLQGS